MPESSKVVYRIAQVPVEEILPLRHRVLRPGLPFESARFKGDALPESVHLALYAGDPESVVAVASLYRQSREVPSSPRLADQLRGMASAPEVRGQGYGALLLQYAEALSRERGVEELWFNARISAQGFYARAGFETVSDVFEIPGVGPHVVMIKTWSSSAERTL